MKTLKNPIVHIANRTTVQVDEPLCSVGILKMENKNEIWKDVVGYEGKYEVSSLGSVMSVKKSRLIAKGKTKHGYNSFQLFINSASKNKVAHRLVAKAFIPNIENKPCVNHINGIKTDNRVENLEWCTYSENLLHRYRVLKINIPTKKLTDEQATEIILSDFYGWTMFFAKKFGISTKTVWKIKKNPEKYSSLKHRLITSIEGIK